MKSVDPIIISMDDENDNINDTPSVIDELKSLQPLSISNDEPVMVSSFKKKNKQPKEKKKKKKKATLSALVDDSDLLLSNTDSKDVDNIDAMLDVDAILLERDDEFDESDEIVTKGRKGYKKLKNNSNNFKKEFAEEITLLYSLLDETTQYGKELEKDLKSMRNSKVRGVSKYSNDLASLVLTAKQTKLNILKEITSVKKNIADLGIKENKDAKNNINNSNSNEVLASQYFKNILTYGRGKYIDRMSDIYDDADDMPVHNEDDDYDTREYNRVLEERLNSNGNPYRSEEGGKYIEYEDRDVSICVNKCIDTGEWDFIAIDKTGVRVDDYPLPDKRTCGRMKFSDDSEYAVDKMGRMYKIIEYYLPETDNSDDDDEDYE